MRGVCGKNEEVAKLQDLLVYTVKGICDIVVKGKIDVNGLSDTNYEVLNSLFMTITNANFDGDSIEKQIQKMLSVRDNLRKSVAVDGLHDAATFTVDSRRICFKSGFGRHIVNPKRRCAFFEGNNHIRC